jgi:Casein kinase II regulatory subunit
MLGRYNCAAAIFFLGLSSSLIKWSYQFFSIHSYIVTNRGMHAMYEKYRTAAFGRCPHVFCQGQPVLPVGLSDLPRNYTVNVFCPRCHGLFFPKSTRQANIDGAYFGTTFPHLYLMTHPVRASRFRVFCAQCIFSQLPSMTHD